MPADIAAGVAGRWDYIIVGAGSADPATNVLLIAEGPPADGMMIRMPLGFARVLANPARASYAISAHDRGAIRLPRRMGLHDCPRLV